jgi:hypothetical protein
MRIDEVVEKSESSWFFDSNIKWYSCHGEKNMYLLKE